MSAPVANPPPVRAIIFDMDGVIVDSEPLHAQALVDTLAGLGIHHPPRFLLEDYAGRGDRDLWRDFIARHQPAQTLEELLRLKSDRVVELVRARQPFFPGLPKLIRALARRWPLGLASGSDRPVIDAVLELEGLRDEFRVVVSSNEVKEGKPKPDVFLLTARRLGSAPADCVVVEDSKPGVAAALAAGMRVLAVANTHPAKELAHATWTVATSEEMGQLLFALG